MNVSEPPVQEKPARNFFRRLAFWERPKVYRIYTHPGKKVVALKRGFNWVALLLPLVWLPVRGLWGQWAILLLSSLTLWLAYIEVAYVYPPDVNDIVQPLLALTAIAIAVGIGALGNRWREQRLLGKHYTRQIELLALSAKDARAQWQKRTMPVRPPS